MIELEFLAQNTPAWLSQGSWPLGVDIINLVTLIYLVICGFTDIMLRKLFNQITFGAMLTGLVLNTVTSGLSGFSVSISGLIAGFGLFFLAFLFGGMGGGDVKLMGGIGALQGYPFVMYAICVSLIFGFIGSLFVIIMSGQAFASFRRVFRVIFSFLRAAAMPGYTPEKLEEEHSQKIPFGYACVLGTMCAWYLIGANVIQM